MAEKVTFNGRKTHYILDMMKPLCSSKETAIHYKVVRVVRNPSETIHYNGALVVTVVSNFEQGF